MSQSEFAEAAGVVKRTQILYEAGDRVPDAKYLANAAQVGADIVYLVTGRRQGIDPEIALFDWPFFRDLFFRIEEWAERRPYVTSPKTKYELLTMAYRLFEPKKQLDAGFLSAQFEILDAVAEERSKSRVPTNKSPRATRRG